MKGVDARPYRLLSDHGSVYEFLLEIYEMDRRNGVPAPFVEYALASSWMDLRQTHRFRIWHQENRIVAFCFSENPATMVYFCLRPGFEELCDEMVDYASQRMPDTDNQQRLVLFGGQKSLVEAAKRHGYERCGSHGETVYTFDHKLDFPLAEGFRFVEPENLCVERITECCWKGFDHEAEEGPWNGDAEHHYHLFQAPHATPQHSVAIADEQGEYVCYAGMWWTPENGLAYLEPLCTVPACRGKGLAAAALSEMYRRMKPLGATHMTGGTDPFYEKMGFRPMFEWTYWKKSGV